MSSRRIPISLAPDAGHAAHGGSPGIGPIQEMVRGCMQCGTCSASCPNAPAMDLTPRQMWRMLLFGMTEEVLASRTFWLCSACYTCTLRCPRGLPLTEAMAALKRLAAAEGGADNRRKGLFYEEFMRNVERNGRVQEAELMFRYLLGMRDPLLPFTFTPLGVRLLLKGKLHLTGSGHRTSLAPLFAKVRSMEART